MVACNKHWDLSCDNGTKPGIARRWSLESIKSQVVIKGGAEALGCDGGS